MKNKEKNLFDIFKKDINPYKPLSRKKEKAMAKTGKAGREKLALHSLFLVINMAKKYRGVGVDFLDLIQEGIIGLFRAVEKFDYQKGYRFSTYAYWWIWQAIVSAIIYQSRTIRIPVHKSDLLYKFKNVTELLNKQLEDWPKNQEMAERMGINLTQVEEIRALQNQSRSISLDAPINSHSHKNADKGFLGDFLSDKENCAIEDVVYQKELIAIWRIASQALNCDNNGRIFQIIAERNQGATLKNILEKRKITCLTDSERLFYILALRNADSTLEEIGQDLYITRERVRQLEAKALRQLRHPKWKSKLEKFL